MLQVAPAEATLIAIDRDETAIEMARPALAEFGDRVAYFHSRFSRLPEILAEAWLQHVDGVLLDAEVAGIRSSTRSADFHSPVKRTLTCARADPSRLRLTQS